MAEKMLCASIDVLRGQPGQEQIERLENINHDIEMRIASMKINNEWHLRKDWQSLKVMEND